MMMFLPSFRWITRAHIAIALQLLHVCYANHHRRGQKDNVGLTKVVSATILKMNTVSGDRIATEINADSVNHPQNTLSETLDIDFLITTALETSKTSEILVSGTMELETDIKTRDWKTHEKMEPIVSTGVGFAMASETFVEGTIEIEPESNTGHRDGLTTETDVWPNGVHTSETSPLPHSNLYESVIITSPYTLTTSTFHVLDLLTAKFKKTVMKSDFLAYDFSSFYQSNIHPSKTLAFSVEEFQTEVETTVMDTYDAYDYDLYYNASYYYYAPYDDGTSAGLSMDQRQTSTDLLHLTTGGVASSEIWASERLGSYRQATMYDDELHESVRSLEIGVHSHVIVDGVHSHFYDISDRLGINMHATVDVGDLPEIWTSYGRDIIVQATAERPYPNVDEHSTMEGIYSHDYHMLDGPGINEQATIIGVDSYEIRASYRQDIGGKATMNGLHASDKGASDRRGINVHETIESGDGPTDRFYNYEDEPMSRLQGNNYRTVSRTMSGTVDNSNKISDYLYDNNVMPQMFDENTACLSCCLNTHLHLYTIIVYMIFV